MKAFHTCLFLCVLSLGCAAGSDSAGLAANQNPNDPFGGGFAGAGVAGDSGSGAGAGNSTGNSTGGTSGTAGDPSGGGTAGTTGGTAGTTGGAAGVGGGTAGTTGGTAGTTGGTAGTTGGTAGTTGGTAGTTGGTAGTTGGGTAGTTGGTAGTTGGGTAGTTGGAAGVGGGTAGTTGGSTPREQYCMGQGPAITVPAKGNAPATCTGAIASTVFTNSLCTCENVSFAGYLVTRSFRSRTQTPLVAQGAPIGVNGDFLAGSYVDGGGTVRIRGNTTFGGYLQVGGDLELTAPITLLGYLTVGRDALFQSHAALTAGAIGRNLYTQAGNIEPPLWVGVGGQRVQSSFSLDTPCKCQPQDLLDIDAIVEDGKQNNDNADPSVSLDASALSNLIQFTRVDLPCGRFYVDSIGGIGALTIGVSGRTALYVGGDVALTGMLNVELGPDGELDLFVGGNLHQIGYGKFGDISRPANVRVYVGGDADMVYLGYQPFGGNLYAPKARLWSDGFVDVRGSLFVRELNAGSYIKVDYDRDVLDLGDQCPPPNPDIPDDDELDPPECGGKCDPLCGSKQACVGGTCGQCSKDSDCCAPLVCWGDGSCGPLLY